jgi:hypothetical protein
VLPTSLSGALAAAHREYGSAAHDEHYRRSRETRPMFGLRCLAPCRLQLG